MAFWVEAEGLAVKVHNGILSVAASTCDLVWRSRFVDRMGRTPYFSPSPCKPNP